MVASSRPDAAIRSSIRVKRPVNLSLAFLSAASGSIRRGPPTRMAIVVAGRPDGGLQAEVVDNAPGERRRATFDELEERARTLNASFEVDQRDDDSGTTVRVTLPPYVAQ